MSIEPINRSPASTPPPPPAAAAGRRSFASVLATQLTDPRDEIAEVRAAIAAIRSGRLPSVVSAAVAREPAAMAAAATAPAASAAAAQTTAKVATPSTPVRSALRVADPQG